MSSAGPTPIFMPILGLIKITKTGKEIKKENFTVDLQKYFRQKKRATEEKKARRKKLIKEMTVKEYFEHLREEDRKQSVKKMEESPEEFLTKIIEEGNKKLGRN